jgi:hypothetical protein
MTREWLCGVEVKGNGIAEPRRRKVRKKALLRGFSRRVIKVSHDEQSYTAWLIQAVKQREALYMPRGTVAVSPVGSQLPRR